MSDRYRFDEARPETAEVDTRFSPEQLEEVYETVVSTLYNNAGESRGTPIAWTLAVSLAEIVRARLMGRP